MGNFGGAFVFTSEPDWKLLDKLLPEVNLQGYKNNTRAVWLLDYWTGGNDHFPFTEVEEEVCFEAIPDDDLSVQFTQIRRTLASSLPSFSTYGAEWHKFARLIAQTLKLRTFFFAGDDELFDFACTMAADGSTESLACTFGYGKMHLRYGDKHWTVAPRLYDGDEDDDRDDDDDLDDDDSIREALRTFPLCHRRDAAHFGKSRDARKRRSGMALGSRTTRGDCGYRRRSIPEPGK